MYTTLQLNILLLSICIFISFAILLFLLTSGDRNSPLNRLFTRLMICNIAATTFAFFGVFDGTEFRTLYRILVFLSYASVNLLLPLLTGYIYALVEREKQYARIITHTIWIAYIISLIALLVSQFNGMFYVISEDNRYIPGEYFWTSQIFGALSLLIITTLILRYRKILNKSDVLYLLFFPFISIIAIIIQVNIPADKSVGVIYITNAFFAIFCYGGIQARQAKLLKDKELELTESRIAAMLSQIQPHFLYNSLL